MKVNSDIRQFGAETLVERVRRNEQFHRVTRAILGGDRRVDIAGLRGSSPAFLVEALRAALRRPVVVCCPDDETARDVRADLGTISRATVRLLPEKDIFPRRFELRENLGVRGGRNATLDAVLRGGVDVVVTSILGFLEKSIPVDVLRANSLDLRRGGELDLEELRDRLVRVGYDATHTVEESGQYAVRGAIVDIFDPSADRPVRFELVDDEVASIRTFDIDSQRSVEQLEAVRILPATGILVNDTSLDKLETNLRRSGMPQAILERIRGAVADRQSSYLLRRYAPAMGMDGALLDFYRTPPLLFFWGEEDLVRTLDRLPAEIEHIAKQIDSEEPLLELYDYLHRPEYYTAYGFPAVHLWGLPGLPAGRAPKPDGGPRSKADDDQGAEAATEPPSPPGPVIEFHTKDHPAVMGKFDSLLDTIRRLRSKRVDVHIYSESAAQRERLADMLGTDEELVHLPVGWMTSGFVWETSGLAVLTDHQIFHRSLPRPAPKRPARRVQIQRPDHLEIGDFVVHVDYGIGRYLGLEKVGVDDHEAECLTLRYQGTDRIYVPLDQMVLVEKYVGKEGVVPRIDRLGSTKWQRTKERTRKAL
ncbi:MAG: CarD family transcriptional regulator, partial [bacterium]